MATANEQSTNSSLIKKQRSWARRDGPLRFTVEQFVKLYELGFFEDRKVELIQGIIHEMTTKPPHAISSDLTGAVLRTVFAAGWVVREMKPLDTGRRSLLEPDFYVVPGTIRGLGDSHPTIAALVVEISESTLRKDRTIKAHLYARANLPDYWIVNLVERQLEVHRNPGPDPARKGRFRYAEVTIVPESGRMSPLAAPQAQIAVADLLP